MKRTAFISDGLHRKSLAAVRALGKHGVEVLVASDEFFAPSFWSRYTRKKFPLNLIAGEINSNEVFFSQFSDSKPVFFPMEDATIQWLSSNREYLSNYFEFLIPCKDSLIVSFSKYKTSVIARKLGLSVPDFLLFESPVDLRKTINANVNLYLNEKYLLKPEIGHGSAGIIYLDGFTENEWNNFDLEKHFKCHGNVLLQRRLPSEGKSIGVSLLFDSSNKLIANFVHQRISSYPISGGPSTNRVGIEDNYLLEQSVKLLEELKWQGVAMVEWKIDSTTGLPYLLEINPRFWGSLELAIRSGVNFPVLYYDLVCGNQVAPKKSYRLGIIVRWVFPGDILRFFSSSRSERESLTKFIRLLFKNSEEWDRKDISGSMAAIFAPLFMLFKRKYWKLLNR